jgi:hypothetical protein
MALGGGFPGGLTPTGGSPPAGPSSPTPDIGGSSQLGFLVLGGAGLGDVEESSGSFPGSIAVEVTTGQPLSFTNPHPGSIAVEVTVGSPTSSAESEPGSVAVEVTVAGPAVTAYSAPGAAAAEVTVSGPTVSAVALPGSVAVEVTVGEPSTAGQSQVISTHAVIDVRGPISYSSDNAYSFITGGADITGLFDATRNPLSISRELNGRSTASYGLISVDGTYSPTVGDDVFIMWGSEPIFGGTIQEFTETTEGASGIRLFSVSATDYNAIMDRRVVYRNFRAFSAKEIVESLVLSYLEPEGVEFVTGEGDPNVDFEEDIVFNGITLADAMARMRDLTGWETFIDDYKRFHFFDPEVGWEAAPTTIAQGDGKVIVNSASVRQYRGNYANVQWVRSSIALDGSFTEEQPRRGGSRKFVSPNWGHDPYPPKLILNGTSSGFLIDNGPILNPDINTDGTYAANDDYWQAKIFPPEPGSLSPPTVVLNEFDPDIAAFGEPTSVRIESQLAEGVNQLSKAENADQIAARQAIEGGTGLWEHSEDIGDVENKEEADALAEALLARKGEIPVVVKFQTDVDGWKPGQSVSIALTRPFAPSGTYLIQRLGIEEFDHSLAANPKFLRYTVEAVSGAAQILPLERMRRQRARDRSSRNTNVASIDFLLAKTINGATNPGLATGSNNPNNSLFVTQKGRVTQWVASANTAPTGASIQIDIKRSVGGGGFVSILPTPIVINAGRNLGLLVLSSANVVTLNVGDVLRLDVLQTGSEEKGKDIWVRGRVLV